MPTKIEDVWKVSIDSDKKYERVALLMSLREMDDVAILIYDMGKRIEELEWELKQAKRRRLW